MASLAPGNGWFPRRPPASRTSGNADRRGLPAASNVYAFPERPGIAAAPRWDNASNAALATRLATLLVAESIKAGRTGGWVLGWCVFAIAMASLAWLGLAGALVAAALAIGVPWMTVAIAAAITHTLGIALWAILGVRFGRKAVASMERKRLRSAP